MAVKRMKDELSCTTTMLGLSMQLQLGMGHYNKYFEFKNLWGCHPLYSNYLAASLGFNKDHGRYAHSPIIFHAQGLLRHTSNSRESGVLENTGGSQM